MAASVDTSTRTKSPGRGGLVRAGTTPLHRLDGELWVELVAPNQLDAEKTEDWDDLASNACDPNVFFERWFLQPAIQAFGASRNIKLAMVYRGSSRKDVACGLVGLFPVEFAPASRLKARVLKLLSHDYSFLLTPLIRLDHAVEAWEAFLEWADQKSGCDLVELTAIRGEGTVAKALADVLYRRNAPSLYSSMHVRALLRRGPSAEECLATALTTKQRHQYERQHRRLSEQGAIEVREMVGSDLASQWIDWFLDLESRGWKGAAQTALASDPVACQFIKQVLQAAADQGRLQMIGMWQNDRPVAMKLNLLASPGSFAFKIAYDESLSRFSPGVLLELENIKVFHNRTDVAWMDSCAAPEHPMINRIWRDRILLQQVLVSTGTLKGDLGIGLRPLARVIRRLMRRQRPDKADKTSTNS